MRDQYRKEKTKLELEILKHNRKFATVQMVIDKVVNEYGKDPAPKYKYL